jgi:hypothetical protein
VEGSAVQNTSGENLVVHAGEVSNHLFVCNWTDSQRSTFDRLLEWCCENWRSIAKLVPLKLNSGVAFRPARGIWFDFLIRIADHDPLVRVEEPKTMIGEHTSATRSALQFGEKHSFFKIGSTLPESYIHDEWVVVNEHVWENSLFALQWLIEQAEAKPTRDDIARRYFELETTLGKNKQIRYEALADIFERADIEHPPEHGKSQLKSILSDAATRGINRQSVLTLQK